MIPFLGHMHRWSNLRFHFRRAPVLSLLRVVFDFPSYDAALDFAQDRATFRSIEAPFVHKKDVLACAMLGRRLGIKVETLTDWI